MRTEFGGLKWTLFGVLYQTTLAYVLAFIINQLGSVIVLGTPFGAGGGTSFCSSGDIGVPGCKGPRLKQLHRCGAVWRSR